MEKTTRESDFKEKFLEIRNSIGRIVEWEVKALKKMFLESPKELLPVVHEIYSEEDDPEHVDYLAYFVLEVFPDRQSIDILLKSDETLTKPELEEYPGFVEYLKHNEDPFVNRDMSMFKPRS